MEKEVCISTREAADHLRVHARTIRKWIDTFEEYVKPDWNERGHYILDEQSLVRLTEIKARLQEPQASMKQVREDLMREGKMQVEAVESYKNLQQDTEKSLNHLMETMESVGDMMEDLFERMERLEGHMYGLFDSLEDMEHKLVSVSYETVHANEVQQMFDDIRKRQDQLRMELRNATFTQRLTASASEQGLLPRRQKKARFLGIF
ncbi:MerR family transcriptional regulator [Hazenella sp. IB182357]|uniref:MerR family transcriptional regulator n=1 Tax=Polycladospora coralii TaxID=2771432 RepID=A0A926N5H1_9BACL|nr:MerR family transcriptional regulator [Polycladospora coralii]MBD1370871.1 MerR family transcriptional regulator [Polycladospora coralii]MBS7529810.1 MerR family transcriptional regulator [Polycladospora coralii]